MRKSKIKKRIIIPDPKYKDILVTRFVNNIMINGKKSLAYKIFYNALKIIKNLNKDKNKNEIDIWKLSLKKIMPHVEIRSRRIGGSTFQIPIQIKSDRKIFMAMKWLIYFSRKRKEKNMSKKLANEIISAYKEEGLSIKKRIDTHKMAESNKAFSHFKF